MKLQVWRYENAVPGIINVYKNNSNKPLRETLSNIAVSTHVPIVACSYFLENHIGESEELTNIRKSLIDFYKYESIEIEEPKND